MLGFVGVSLPFLIAFSVSPSSTYFNQALSFGGCAAWLFWWALRSGGFTGGRTGESVPAGTRWILLALVVLALAMIPPGAPIGQRLMPMGCVILAAALVYAAARTASTGDDQAFAVPLMSALLAAGIASLAIGVVQVFFAEWADGVVIAVPTIAGRAIGNMRQPNQLSTLLMWAIAAAVWLGVRSRWPKGLLIGVVVALVFGVALTASRTGTVGIVLLVVWGLIDRRLPGWVRLLLLACLPLYALSWWGLEQWLSAHGVAYYGEDQIKKTLHGDASSSRGRIWSNAWAMIQAHPWFGTGVGAFNFVWSMTPFPDRPVAFFDHTHNIALQLAAEYGLPIAAVVLLALLWGIGSAHPALRAAQDDRARGARAALFMLVLVGVHSLLEYPLWYSYFLLPTALLAGWLTGSAASDGLAPAASGARGGLALPIGRVGLPACLLVGLLASVGTLWATAQYAQVAVIFEPELAPGEPKSLEERIARGQTSLFFGHHADYAKVTMAEHPEQVFDAFERPLYHLMDTRITMAYARALAARGEMERARHVAARLKEFHNPGSEDFFSSCDPASAAALARQRASDAEPRPADILASGVPFQCGTDPRLDAARLVLKP
ncbi:MAG TPA: Wzy polymerase domain-containing protein [Burkholderiaceae bacterium]|nr:Wzy polymerase domain-containing protein [Burkholderiaceae bacterium]HMX10797.1 Wzy polymerase domain-containing protein [Burkholderiaceae bacterium]HMZ00208.1 Wzy polymerase domain-containing protein [Burkholderiaceae bacterium]HNB44323.1 Wzy polymerase domain-containing protein [Burkholderiaceae bacterium]HNG78810.1 Wzy polymerase domain-containing protein [Burkholderiaceae bacterium]